VAHLWRTCGVLRRLGAKLAPAHVPLREIEDLIVLEQLQWM
jgi:hypothetical protein